MCVYIHVLCVYICILYIIYFMQLRRDIVHNDLCILLRYWRCNFGYGVANASELPPHASSAAGKCQPAQYT